MGRAITHGGRFGAALLVVAMLAALASGCGSSATGAVSTGLTDITSVAELRDAVAADTGSARLILILSPT